MASTVRFPVRSAALLLGTAATAGAAYYSYDSYKNNARFDGHEKGGIAFPIASTAGDGKKSPFSSFGFTALTLEECHMVNHNVKFLRFRLPKGYEDSSISPITSMITMHTPENAWIPVFRPYTPVEKDEPGHLSFLVKKYPSGKGSGHLHSLIPGDQLNMKPLHEFDYKPNQYSSLTILAGGAGITPFIQLIRSVLRDPSDKTCISLVYANNAEEDILLRNELDRLAAERPRQFSRKYVVTRPSPESDGQCEEGHMTRQMIEAVLPPKVEWAKSKVLVCGPDPMIEAVAGKKGFGFAQGSLGGHLKDIGLEKEQVQKF